MSIMLCKRPNLYLNDGADDSADADTEMSIPRFPNG